MEWFEPVVVGADGLDLHVELFAEEDGRIGYEIYSGGADEERVIHSQGCAVVEPAAGWSRAAEMNLRQAAVGTLLVQRAWQARERRRRDWAPSLWAAWVVLCGGGGVDAARSRRR